MAGIIDSLKDIFMIIFYLLGILSLLYLAFVCVNAIIYNYKFNKNRTLVMDEATARTLKDIRKSDSVKIEIIKDDED